MNLSQNGLDLIKGFEGCRLTAYRDAVGVWTIGFGHTGYVKFFKKNVCEGMTITLGQAEELLYDDCQKFVTNVNKYQAKYDWNQNQFDALVSFAFNIGSINQLTDNGTRTNEVIASKILEYKNAGSKKGLLLPRRKKEQALFLKGTTSQDTSIASQNPYTVPQNVLRKGSVGKEVKWLQWELKQSGYGIVVDGYFGKKTLEAVRKFQYENKLQIDGVVGGKTVAKLLAK